MNTTLMIVIFIAAADDFDDDDDDDNQRIGVVAVADGDYDDYVDDLENDR